MADKNAKHNTECKSDLHKQHLCYLISQGFNVSDKEEYDALIKDPQFKCSHCGNTAHSANNLCKPAKLETE